LRNGLKWLSVLTSAGMFIVLLAGALVTKTESGRGCGDDWPLCNGKFIPAYTIESLIEYSHRAVTGVVGLLVLFTALWVWKALRNHTEAVLYAFGALFFTILQAILGAMAVMWEQSSAVMALHFGFSLLAFASTLLLALYIRSYDAERKGLDIQPEESYTMGQASPVIARSFVHLVWATTIYSYVVIYIGAFVRHTESSGGCTGWPLCNGQWIPPLSGASGIVFGHRVAALIFLLIIIWLAFTSVSRYRHIARVKNAGLSALYLTVLQVASGAWVVAVMGSDLYVLASLFHTVIIAGLFGVLCYFSIIVWQYNKHGHSDRPVDSR
jgi:cytochrome c oxidase assembly protein subunit 15